MRKMLKYLGLTTLALSIIAITVLIGVHCYKFRDGSKKYTIDKHDNILTLSLNPPLQGTVSSSCNLVIKNKQENILEKTILEESYFTLSIVDAWIDYQGGNYIIHVLITRGIREHSFSHILYSFVFNNKWKFLEEQDPQCIMYTCNELQIAIYLIPLIPIGLILLIEGRQRLRSSRPMQK